LVFFTMASLLVGMQDQGEILSLEKR